MGGSRVGHAMNLPPPPPMDFWKVKIKMRKMYQKLKLLKKSILVL
jgi:hypothetical protein